MDTSTRRSTLLLGCSRSCFRGISAAVLALGLCTGGASLAGAQQPLPQAELVCPTTDEATLYIPDGGRNLYLIESREWIGGEESVHVGVATGPTLTVVIQFSNSDQSLLVTDQWGDSFALLPNELGLASFSLNPDQDYEIEAVSSSDFVDDDGQNNYTVKYHHEGEEEIPPPPVVVDVGLPSNKAIVKPASDCPP